MRSSLVGGAGGGAAGSEAAGASSEDGQINVDWLFLIFVTHE